MEIQETGVWNSFLAVLKRKPEEDDRIYFRKALACLEQFYFANTLSKRPDKKFFWNARGKFEPTNYRDWGGNFCDMDLKVYCDVKYRINMQESSGIRAGIFVASHRIENRRAQIEYLKQRWQEFQFNEQSR